MRIAVLLLLLMGCTPIPIVRVAGGISPGTELAEATYMRWSNSVYTAEVVRVAPQVMLSWDNIDVGVGPTLTIPTDGVGGTGGGGEFMIRPRLVLGRIEPYVYFTTGIEYYSERWGWTERDTQGSLWGFPTEVGAGFRFRTSDKQWITLDYGFFHESNGSRYYSFAPEPNPGFNGDIIYLGYEWAF